MIDDDDLKKVLIRHHRVAQRLAHRLYSFSSAIWPEAWYDIAHNDFTDDFLGFCMHAYRVSEILGVLSERIDISNGGTVMFADSEDANWFFDYHQCLNLVRHSTQIKHIKANAQRKIFAFDENIMAGGYRVSSDRHPDDHDIPVFALAISYLQYIRPKVARSLTD